MGDFNFNFLVPSPNLDRFKCVVNSFQLLQVVSDATRVTNHSKTCLDQIFIDTLNYPPFALSNFSPGYSDHNCLILQLLCDSPEVIDKNSALFRSGRFFSPPSIKIIKQLLLNEHWNDVYDAEDVNAKYNKFSSILNYYCDMVCPVVKKRVFNKSKPISWITQGIIISCKRKQGLHTLVKNTSNLIIKNYYNKYCSILKKVIRQAKLMANNKFIKNSDNVNKATWQVVNSEVSLNRKLRVCNVDEIICDTRLEKDPYRICNIFNKHFVSPFQQQCRSQANSINNITSNSSSLYFDPCTPSEVSQVIFTLKKTNSSGPDFFNTLFIRECADLLSAPLADIINTAFLTGVYPDSLKITKIIPVHKKGDKKIIDNYRPIALLSVFDKVMERLIHHRLNNFIESSGLISNYQFGFRKSRSTTDALLYINEFIAKAKYDNLYVAGIFLDLSKAFDLIDHSLLLAKLEKFGIRGICLELLTSYLKARSHFVELKGVQSELLPADKGVPQGSILGPLLFNVFINDLADEMSEFGVCLYADDTTVLVKSDSINSFKLLFCRAWRKLDSWVEKNNLRINLKKTVCVNFTNSRLPFSNSVFELNNLSWTDETVILGVHLDKDLFWRHHIVNLTPKLQKLCFALRILRQSVTLDILIRVYYCCFQTLFRYGLIFWGNTSISKSVFLIQKKILRIMTFAGYRDSCKPIFATLGLLPLPCLYIFDTIMVVRQHRGELTLNKDVHQHATRQASLYRTSLLNNTAAKRVVLHNGILLYNALPDQLRVIECNKKFKNSFKSFLLTKLYYTVEEFLLDNF